MIEQPAPITHSIPHVAHVFSSGTFTALTCHACRVTRVGRPMLSIKEDVDPDYEHKPEVNP